MDSFRWNAALEKSLITFPDWLNSVHVTSSSPYMHEILDKVGKQ